MAQNISISVCLSHEKRLEQAFAETKIKKPSSVKKLIILGTVTIEDFHYIQTKMRRTLRELDMQEASVECNVIPNWAFNHCTALISIKIPNSVNKIGKCAFWKCSSLGAIKIPDSVSEIDIDAFNYAGNTSCIEISENPDETKNSIFCKPDIRTMLAQFLPENSLNEIMFLIQEHTIHLRITLPRKSVLGTYLAPVGRNYHIITINGDLNKYEFLYVFLHEYAHLLAHFNGEGYPPHGIGWKNTFRELLHYFIQKSIFQGADKFAVQNNMVRMYAIFTTELKSTFSKYGDNKGFFEKIEYCCS
jgi:hypothetical protein